MTRILGARYGQLFFAGRTTNTDGSGGKYLTDNVLVSLNKLIVGEVCD